MSGGIAYFYDPDDKLVENLNPELVDVEQLGADDLAFLEETIADYRKRPFAGRRGDSRGFRRRKGALPQGDARDYKRVLLAIEAAERDGRDVNDAIMEAANG